MTDTPKAALSFQLRAIANVLQYSAFEDIAKLAIELEDCAARADDLERACAMYDEMIDGTRQDERAKFAALRDSAIVRMKARARARSKA